MRALGAKRSASGSAAKPVITGVEAERSWLTNTSLATKLFGDPAGAALRHARLDRRLDRRRPAQPRQADQVRGAQRRVLEPVQARRGIGELRAAPVTISIRRCSSSSRLATTPWMRPSRTMARRPQRREQLVELRRDDDDGDAVGGELAEQRVDLLLGADIDAARRLVADEHLRLRQDGAREDAPSAGCRRSGRRSARRARWRPAAAGAGSRRRRASRAARARCRRARRPAARRRSRWR